MLFQTFRSRSELSEKLIDRLSQWFNYHNKRLDDPNVQIEEDLVELAYHITKKCWPIIHSASGNSMENVNEFIQAVGCICCKVSQKVEEHLQAIYLFLGDQKLS